MSEIFETIERKVLEFADGSFLNYLLADYDTEAIVYRVVVNRHGTENDDRKRVKYDFDGIILELIDKFDIEISIYRHDISDYEETYTTFGELKCEWKKLAIDNLNEIRAERSNMRKY